MVGEAVREVRIARRRGAEGRRHRVQLQLHLRRADPRRADAAVPRVRGRQLHRGHAGEPVLPDRRVEVRQADHRPRHQSGDRARRSRQVRADLDGLDAALEHLGRPAARPARLRGRGAAGHAFRADRPREPVHADDPQHLGRAPEAGVPGDPGPDLARRTPRRSAPRLETEITQPVRAPLPASVEGRCAPETAPSAAGRARRRVAPAPR